MLARFIPTRPEINFLGQRNIAIFLSLLLIAASLFLLFTRGLNFGIDFSGGIVMEVRLEEEIPLKTIRDELAKTSISKISLQSFGNKNDLMIRVGQSKEDNNQAEIISEIKSTLEAGLSTGITYRKVDYVGPQVGEELIQAGALALGLAFAAIMIYIWLRFEWHFGFGAIVALIHDTILTLGLYSITNIEFNLTSVAAILTIIGYSINDSVVIFDRIRENLRKFKKMLLPEILNRSINETLSRTLLTAGTTLVALLSLVLLGGEVLKGFSIAVLFGVIVGTYSSIYVASPILVSMRLRQE